MVRAGPSATALAEGRFIQRLDDLIQTSGAALIVILALVFAVVVGVAAIGAKADRL